jgi:hypothetical protein
MPEAWDEFAADELATVLAESRVAAEGLLDLARGRWKVGLVAGIGPARRITGKDDRRGAVMLPPGWQRAQTRSYRRL